MALNKNAEENQDYSADNGTDLLEAADFFEAEISRYSANLEADPEETYRRYGFTLYHSLPPVQMVLESQKLGFWKEDAVDKYNLAGIEIGKENFEGARELLEEVIKEDPEMPEAAYNLAMCYERLDRKAEALPLWNKYLELADEEEDEDVDAVRAHVAELQG